MNKILLAFISASFLFASCSKESEKINLPDGKLVLNASGNADVTMKGAVDVSNFNVTITQDGEITASHTGTVSSITSPISLTPGTYTVNVASPAVTMPAFSAPMYGATKTGVTIVSEQTTTVDLTAVQTNAGIKVAYAQAMLDYCTTKGYDISTVVTAGTSSLDFGKKSTVLETKAGYFNPGTVTVKVTMNGNTYTKDITLAARELVTVNINVNKLPAPQLQMTITADNGTTASSDTFTFNEI